MKKYIPSNPYKRLVSKVFESYYSIEGILSRYFGIYKDCNNGKWRTEDKYLEEL